ncbi:non-homologous end-joining DNA ligase [Candidatus Babeliales bacterium]|nr:non-homologous end-joining DNA ligase [Candidatus Babeliales bacterium]
MSRVIFTNKEKVWFSKTKITKGDILAYYKLVAPIMRPYLKDRPLVMQRYPDGIKGESFYQKDIPDYFPDWIPRLKVKKEGGTVTHVLCNTSDTLLYIVNQGCLTPHIWLSKKPNIRKPDRMIFDLDPSSRGFGPVVDAAHRLKVELEDRGLVPFVMTTGSRGVHVVVPLKPSVSFMQVKRFAKNVARTLCEKYPDEVTLETRKAKRRARLYIDVMRNAYAQTGVCPYAVRALPEAPVATPLLWKELTKRISAHSYTIKSIKRRLKTKANPWRDFVRSARMLPRL